MSGRLRPTVVGKYALGPLELQLLRLLWSRGDATVRELIDSGELKVAYTTVMTTLDRLYKKGVLARESDGKGFRYRAKQTEAELEQQAVSDGLRALLASAKDSAIPVSFLVDTVTEHDRAALDELARAVEEKRQALKRGKR